MFPFLNVFPTFAEQRHQHGFDDVRSVRTAAEVGRRRYQEPHVPRAQFVDVTLRYRFVNSDLSVEPVGHELPYEMKIAGDDLRLGIVLGIFWLRGPILFLPGRIEELKRQVAGGRQILFGERLELGEAAYRLVEIERKDEVAEQDVRARIDERLRHTEAVERADHQNLAALQLDTEFVAQEAHGLALERVLQPAAVDNRRLLHGTEQTQAVTERVAFRPRVEVHVDAAEADCGDLAVHFVQFHERTTDRAVGSDALDVEELSEKFDERAVIARRRPERNRDDALDRSGYRRHVRITARGTPGSGSHGKFTDFATKHSALATSCKTIARSIRSSSISPCGRNTAPTKLPAPPVSDILPLASST